MTTTNSPNSPVEQEILEGLAINLNLSQELLTTLEEENTALRAMDTQGLFRISRHKDTLLAKLHYLDDSLRNSLAEEGKTQRASDPTSERMRMIGQYKEKIRSLRQEIQTRNWINKRFTEDTLSYLSDAIALITRPVQAENTYRIPGRSLARGKNMPSFISREV